VNHVPLLFCEFISQNTRLMFPSGERIHGSFCYRKDAPSVQGSTKSKCDEMAKPGNFEGIEFVNSQSK
jgi:hypothetical protein